MGVSLPKRRPTDRTLLIMKMLYEEGELPSATIAKRLGIPSKTVASYLSHLKKRGLVEYVNGFWRLTEAGKRVFEKYRDVVRG